MENKAYHFDDIVKLLKRGLAELGEELCSVDPSLNSFIPP